MNLLLLFLPLLAISFLCNAEDATQLVYDIENHEVTSDEAYYVLPAEHETGGGLEMMMHAGERCKCLVSQASNVDDIGTPVQFVPSNKSSSGNILASTNIAVRFSVYTICVQSMYWHVNYPAPGGRVVVGKDEGMTYPVPLSANFMFRIERYNSKIKGYKLVSCAGEGSCKDLGMSASKNENLLAISDSPLVVMFKKRQYP